MTSRSFVIRSLLLCSLASVFVVACAGGPDAPSSQKGSERGGGLPGLGSSDGDGSGLSGDDGSGASASQAIDTTGVTEIVVSRGYCGGAPGQCYGQFSYTLDVAASSFVSSSCVGDGGSEESTPKTLSAEKVKTVLDALGGVRVTSEVDATNQDGAMWVLRVKSASGAALYSPAPSCNHAQFKAIVAGWDPLFAAMEDAGK